MGSGFSLALFFLRKPIISDSNDTARNPAIEVTQNTAAADHPKDGPQVVNIDAPTHQFEVSQVEASQGSSSNSSSSKKLTVKEFKNLTSKALSTLPKQEPKEGLTDEEAHHLSADDMEALQPFIDIVQAVEDNPSLLKPAFDFFRRCATDDKKNIAYTLRSRCLSKMRKYAPSLGHSEQDEVHHLLHSNTLNPLIIDYSNQIPD